MKKSAILELKDMSDSREVLSERPRRSMAWFIYILIALIAVALVWSFIGEIDYYVRAQGSVRPNEPISTIRNGFTGRVDESFLEEGRQVARGELLFRIDAETQINMERVLSSQYDSLSAYIQNLEKFRSSVVQESNLFNRYSDSESEFFFMFEKYETDRALAVEQVKQTNMDFQRVLHDATVQLDNASNSGMRFSSDLQAWRLLQESVERGTNLVPQANGEQYSRFLDYMMNIQRYDSIIGQLEQAYVRAEALFDVGGISARELENAQNELESTLIDRDRYKNETGLNAQQNIRSLELTIRDLEAQSKSASATIEAFSQMRYDEELILNKHRLDALTSASDAIFSYQNNLNSLYMELVQIRLSITEASVFAPISGTINLYNEVNSGDFIQAGMEIGTIVPDAEGTLKVQMAVLHSDIAEIQVGQDVRYRFPALPHNDFGEMIGRITTISSDARQDNQGNSYFLVEGELFGHSLRNRSGTEEFIRVGMAAEVRVITRTERIIYWILDKLNFLDN